MHHRVYNLNHGVSLMGLRPQDLMVILFSVMIGLNVLGALFPGYLRLVVAAAFIFITFKVWQGLRDRVPDKYFLHLFRWLSEPEVYRVAPDLRAIPLIVDPGVAADRHAITFEINNITPKRPREEVELVPLA